MASTTTLGSNKGTITKATPAASTQTPFAPVSTGGSAQAVASAKPAKSTTPAPASSGSSSGNSAGGSLNTSANRWVAPSGTTTAPTVEPPSDSSGTKRSLYDPARPGATLSPEDIYNKDITDAAKGGLVSGGGGSGGGSSGRGGGSSGGGGGSGGGGIDANTPLDIPTQDPEAIAAARAALSAELNPEWEKAQIDRVNYYDKQPLVDLMNQEIDAARAQYNNQIDRSMDTAARDLNRALTDAQDAYRTQQNQITAEEMQARDNAALYAEARGDKGGIGQAQYNSIQNTAAQNRLQVRNAQTKLATDTARQISDLRAQGEFERADRMLELTQKYLSELRQIEEYAANYNLSVDQINTAIAEWEYNYNQAAQQFATNTELSLAELTGSFANGVQTYAAKRDTDKALADLALSMIQAGVRPDQLTSAQLGALAEVYGMGQTGINQFYNVSR